MENLPSGTVTFLFTDIEDSTKLARAHRDRWEASRQHHHSILRAAMDANRGYVFQIIGDAFCVAFSTARDALLAASTAQTNLDAENWGDCPIKVRMGIHTGNAELQENGEYNGYITLSRVQRIMSAGHGGQTLLSQATQELVRDELPEKLFLFDLGEHRLKDLVRPEHIYQVNIDGFSDNFPPLKTLDIFQHNLPVQLTSFIGREKEIAEIKLALAEHNLVTLTGPGGSGKTRLSLQVAAELVDEFSDGVWFVDLAPLSDPAFITQAIAVVMDVREEGSLPLIDLLVNYLQRRNLLIVLDNCEHLIDSSARIVNRLLQSAPQLKIIATSREALGIAGEKAFMVPSLSFSSARHPSSSSLSQYEATRLFIDRALLVKPHFSVNNENAPAVAQICYRLDGIPLAIELAAARIKAMSPEQISVRLDDSFRLLTGGNRMSLPRQQTLRAMIDWSWDLLVENERALLRQLSVFAGGWTLEAAEEICGGGEIEQSDILDLLTQLVSKSLVVWNEQQDEPRYQLLETIRQYALGKLSEADEMQKEASLRQRHAEFYAHFAQQAEAKIYSPSQAIWLKRLDIEQDNFRSALEWTLNSKSPLAMSIFNAWGNYLYWQKPFEEGAQWGRRVLSANLEAEEKVRGYTLLWSSTFEFQLGHIDQAKQYCNEGLNLARQGQDSNLLAFALTWLGGISVEGGEPQLAKACLEEALPLARATQSPFLLPLVLGYLGLSHMNSNDYAQAEAFFQESVEIAQRLYSTLWQPMGLLFLGSLALLRNDIEKALTSLTSGLKIAYEIGAKLFIAHIEEMLGRVQIIDQDFEGARKRMTQSITMLQESSLIPCLAHGLEGWSRLVLAQGEAQRATRIMGAISAHMKRLGMNMIPVEQALYDQTLVRVQQQLDPATFTQEWVAGEKLNVDQAIELAMA